VAVAALLAQTHYIYRFILKGFDIQRQQAGILRERAECVHGTGRGRTHMLYSDFSGHGTETSK